MPFCATGGRGHPLSRRTGFEAEAEFQRSNGALRYPGRRCACPGLIDRRTVRRPLVAQAGSLLYRGLGIRRPFTAPAVSPIVSCRPGGRWVAPAADRSVSAARRNRLQQSGAARAMPEEAHSTARQPLECGGCDAAFNPQPASLPKHRTVCRLPLGGTAACHSALQVALGYPLGDGPVLKLRQSFRGQMGRCGSQGGAALALGWPTAAALGRPTSGEAPTDGRSVSGAQRHHNPKLRASSSQLPTRCSMTHAPC